MVINTNILSLIVQQNLRGSQQAVQTAMQRLSSGLRINSAKDDPAGQAIANRMTAQIRGLDQAARNTADGISLVQVAGGALDLVNDNLQRIRELSVQAGNGTLNDKDRDAIQAEIDQRLDEIDRIGAQTRFNGISLLGESRSLNIQAATLTQQGNAVEVGLRTDAVDLIQPLVDLGLNGGTVLVIQGTIAGLHRELANSLQVVVDQIECAPGHLHQRDTIGGVARRLIKAANLCGHAVGNRLPGRIILGAIDAQAR